MKLLNSTIFICSSFAMFIFLYTEGQYGYSSAAKTFILSLPVILLVAGLSILLSIMIKEMRRIETNNKEN
ncbi:hypothetical protein BN1058_01865 [Paraliobacillus sp. PM-2]|uniref:hypothetical protein n=1 Tax=Paraliobacillus sp. PM-2 TaxID=1462524 RepID=UPI00061BDA88|nr:hypothetical protein [Paraliobacillus sp. PM-2]CQR47541.1 hypothetical protein BN1058_01865 [Paraliobacillus sp. PM-2]